jgi:DNA-binding NarL/FixJ family response regulator
VLFPVKVRWNMAELYSLVIIHNNSSLIESLVSSLTESFVVYCAPGRDKAAGVLSGFPRPDIIILYLENTDEYEPLLSLSGNDMYKDIPVIVLSPSISIQEQIALYNHGVVDCISIPFTIDILKAKMYAIIRFKKYCLECANIKIETEIIKSLEQLGQEDGREQFTGENLYIKYGITLREREIIELLCKGLLNKEIGDTLHVSKRTVEFHINNIYHKFNVTNRMDLLSKINS